MTPIEYSGRALEGFAGHVPRDDADSLSGASFSVGHPP